MSQDSHLPVISFRRIYLKVVHPDHSYLTDTMDEETMDKTAAINLEQVEEPSRIALKKANKHKKLAEEKANKSATNTTKEAARSEAKKAVNKAPKKKIDGAALIG